MATPRPQALMWRPEPNICLQSLHSMITVSFTVYPGLLPAWLNDSQRKQLKSLEESSHRLPWNRKLATLIFWLLCIPHWSMEEHCTPRDFSKLLANSAQKSTRTKFYHFISWLSWVTYYSLHWCKCPFNCRHWLASEEDTSVCWSPVLFWVTVYFCHHSNFRSHQS